MSTDIFVWDNGLGHKFVFVLFTRRSGSIARILYTDNDTIKHGVNDLAWYEPLTNYTIVKVDFDQQPIS